MEKTMAIAILISVVVAMVLEGRRLWKEWNSSENNGKVSTETMHLREEENPK